MKLLYSSTLAAVAVMAAAVAEPGAAATLGPSTFNFFQGGFEEGAFVEGFFVAEDLDMNGQISSFAGEVIDFGATFSGNSLFGSTILGFGDFFGLVYDLDGGVLGDGIVGGLEGIGAGPYAVGPGPAMTICDGLAPCGFFGGASSSEAVIVSNASIPEPLTILGSLVALGGGVVLRKKAAASEHSK